MTESPQPHPLAEDFTWSRLGQPVLTGGQLADKGYRALRRIGEWGIAAPVGNRLARATEMIGRQLGHDLPEPDVGAEAAKTVLDLYLITHAQDERPPDVACAKILEALGGGDTPATDMNNRARDTQFELEIWALFRIAGVDIWFEEPPDLVFRIDDEEIGIAAKRVWSLEQAHKRLSLGAEQIERSGRRGIIATNVQEYLVEVNNGLELASKGRAFNVDVRRVHGHMPYLAGKKHVIGVILRGAKGGKSAVDASPRVHMAVAAYTQLFMFLEDDEKRDFKGLFETMGTRLRDWYATRL